MNYSSTKSLKSFRLVAMTQRFYLNSKFDIKSSKYMYPRSLIHFNLNYFMFVVEDFEVRIKLDLSKQSNYISFPVQSPQVQ